MFSVKQKIEISDAIQKILKNTNHPELPKGEITFSIHIKGVGPWSWAEIVNNEQFKNKKPSKNEWTYII